MGHMFQTQPAVPSTSQVNAIYVPETNVPAMLYTYAIYPHLSEAYMGNVCTNMPHIKLPASTMQPGALYTYFPNYTS